MGLGWVRDIMVSEWSGMSLGLIWDWFEMGWDRFGVVRDVFVVC
jgi:hypothetical protein